MEKQDQLERVSKYFIKTPLTPRRVKYVVQLIFMILGIILLIVAYTDTNYKGEPKTLFIGAAAVLLLISLFSFLAKRSAYGSTMSIYRTAYKRAEPKATDEQMDQWLNEGMEMVEKEARERLDIDEEDSSTVPLVIDGPAANTYIGAGRDKILRFRHHNIILFFLTNHNVASFECVLDLGCGEILNDRTKEFPYKDITNLETETTNDEFMYMGDKKFNTNGLKEFKLYTSGANKMSANYFFNKANVDADYILPPSTAENTIRAIRKRLKEYKDRFGSAG